MRKVDCIYAFAVMCCALTLVPGCRREYKEIDTRSLLNDVRRSLYAFGQDRGNDDPIVKAVGGIELVEEVNIAITRRLIDEGYLIASVLEERGSLRGGEAGKAMLVDAWGRPLIFVIPRLHSAGLTYVSSGGRVTILPLVPSAGPWEEGQVQVWSMGANGRDDRGKGDDILPQL
jgi:hypothetical protein